MVSRSALARFAELSQQRHLIASISWASKTDQKAFRTWLMVSRWEGSRECTSQCALRHGLWCHSRWCYVFRFGDHAALLDARYPVNSEHRSQLP